MHLSSPVDDGELWQVGTREGKEILRSIRIEKHCGNGGNRVIVEVTTLGSTIITGVFTH